MHLYLVLYVNSLWCNVGPCRNGVEKFLWKPNPLSHFPHFFLKLVGCGIRIEIVGFIHSTESLDLIGIFNHKDFPLCKDDLSWSSMKGFLSKAAMRDPAVGE